MRRLGKWVEHDHPRAMDGRFAIGGGGSASSPSHQASGGWPAKASTTSTLSSKTSAGGSPSKTQHQASPKPAKTATKTTKATPKPSWPKPSASSAKKTAAGTTATPKAKTIPKQGAQPTKPKLGKKVGEDSKDTPLREGDKVQITFGKNKGKTGTVTGKGKWGAVKVEVDGQESDMSPADIRYAETPKPSPQANNTSGTPTGGTTQKPKSSAKDTTTAAAAKTSLSADGNPKKAPKGQAVDAQEGHGSAAKPQPQPRAQAKSKDVSKTAGMRDAVRHRAGDDAVAWAMEHLPPPKNLTREEKQGVRNYTGSQHLALNKYLRGEAEGLPILKRDINAWNKTIERVDAALEKSKVREPFITHRGVNGNFADALGADVNDSDSMHALTGMVFDEKGFMSTSVGEGAAYGGKIYLMIRVPAGHEALNVMSLGTFGKAESEVLIRRNTRYVVHSVYERDTKWHMEVEIVPDGWEPPANWKPDAYGDAETGYRHGTPKV